MNFGHHSFAEDAFAAQGVSNVNVTVQVTGNQVQVQTGSPVVKAAGTV